MEKTTKNSFPLADEVIDSVKAKGEEYLEMAKEKGEDLLSDVQSSGKIMWTRTKGLIQKHPAKSIGYAALFGAVLAILFYPKGEK